MQSQDPHPLAAVVHANRFQFLPRQTFTVPEEPTRLLLWGRAGGGAVELGTRRWRLDPGRFVLLPAPRLLTYHADAKDPFLIAGIHLVVRQEGTLRLSIQGEGREDDLGLPALDGDLDGHPRLAFLAEHILAVFESGPPPEWQARSLGRLLAAELADLAESGDGGLPTLLAELRRRLLADLAQPRDLAHLAELAGTSTATLGRLCRRHCRMAPCRWLTSLRIERAAHLVAATALPIGEIGRQVGIEDPYRFSRLFRRWRGRSARELRLASTRR